MTAAHKIQVSNQRLKIALVGNPNVGKSSLFNRLTGARQKIANYAGVTVEKKSGTFFLPSGDAIELIDLPGCYSLKPKSEDEKITVDAVLGKNPELGKFDAIWIIADPAHLSRTLGLVLQLKAIHPNTILVFNMWDEWQSDAPFSTKLISEKLNLPVFTVSARTGLQIQNLISWTQNFKNDFQAPPQSFCSTDKLNLLPQNLDEQVSVLCQDFIQKPIATHVGTDRLDRLTLHPILGPVLFLASLFLFFQILFTWSAPMTDGIEALLSWLADSLPDIPVGWLESLVKDGIIAGVGSVLVFVPQITLTFLMIAFMENSGYLSRGAFLVDRLMRSVGLEGRAFLPLLSSFGCAVPGILATRTIPDAKQRLITILVAPLMTCSARLPVYTLLIATFVPATTYFGFNLQALSLFALFLGGLFMGLLMAFVFDRVLKTKTRSSFFIELPRYRMPSIKDILLYTIMRVKVFVVNAGTMIFALSLVLWALAYFPRSEKIIDDYDSRIQVIQKDDTISESKKSEIIADLENIQNSKLLEQSYMGRLGHAIEPALTPLGYDWKLGIGILASFAAREVFVSTMGIVFSLGEADEHSDSLRETLQDARRADGTPAYTMATAFSLMVFFAFAAQCMSTLAVVRRETNSLRWPIFSFVYMSILAYASAFLVYHSFT